MRIDILSSIISITGLVFVAFSLLIVFLGKKIDPKGSGQQRIKVGSYVEVNANAIITLIIIMVCLSIAPIVLAYWRVDLKNYIHVDEVSQKYIPKKDLSLTIEGAVYPEGKHSADGVFITVIGEMGDSLVSEKPYYTDEQGWFDITLPNLDNQTKYKITWEKEGYAKETLRCALNEIKLYLTLSRGGN